MKTITLNQNFNATSTNKILVMPITLASSKIKIVDASVKFFTTRNGQNSSCKVYYLPSSGKDWGYIDEIPADYVGELNLNISDELQDALQQNEKTLALKLQDDSDLSADLAKGFTLVLDYLPLQEYKSNTSSQQFSVINSGEGSVNLATGDICFTAPLISSDNNVLPLSITANYNKYSSNLVQDAGMPNNWNLNLSQFLVKNQDDTNLSFTFIDQNGKEQLIEEKYYYIDDDNNKIYVKRSELSVDLMGNLIYQDKMAYTTLESETGLKLVSNIEDIKGANLVDHEPEELINIKNQIKELNHAIADLHSAKTLSQKQFCTLVLSKKVLLKQLKIQLETLGETQRNIEFQKIAEELRYTYLNRSRKFKDYNNNEVPDSLGLGTSNKFNITHVNNLFNWIQVNNPPERDLVAAQIFNNELSSIYTFGIKNEDGSTFAKGSLKSQEESLALNKELYTSGITKADFIAFLTSELSNYNTDTALLGNLDDLYSSVSYSDISVGITSTESNADSSEKKLTYGYKDIINLDAQIQNAINTLQNYNTQLTEYEGELKKSLNIQEQYLLQIPHHYLYSSSGIIYGFGKSKDDKLFRLVLIMDSYENAIKINYKALDDNKIYSIIDSNENTILLNYNKQNLLTSIIDASDNKVKLDYKDGKLHKLQPSNAAHTALLYRDDYFIVVNQNGMGVSVQSTDSNVTIDSLSIITNVTNGDILYNGLDSFDDIYNLEISDLTQYKIADKTLTIIKNNYKSAIVTADNKTVTYIFDKLGNTTTIYQDEQSDHPTSQQVQSYNYKNDKINMSASLLNNSDNYLKDACFVDSSKVINDSLYLGEAYCSNYTINHKIANCATGGVHIIESDNKVASLVMSKSMIDALNNDILHSKCNHHAYMLSCFAKADSAYILDDTQNQEDQKTFTLQARNILKDTPYQYPEYIKDRRFNLSCKITYTDGTTEQICRNFDWRYTGWQFNVLPVVLKATICEFTASIDYSNNTGEIRFLDPELKQANITTSEYKNNLLISQKDAHSNYKTEYRYSDDDQLIAEVVTYNTGKTYTTTYQYNKNGKIIKTISPNGIVSEVKYDKNGNQTQSVTYHKDHPSDKFYSEQPVDEKGKATQNVNELGQKVSDIQYVEGTGNISTLTEGDSTTSYGYGQDGKLLQLSHTEGNQECTNTYGYTLDYLTSLTHNGFSVGYNYDCEGRVNNIKVAGKDYLSTSYSKDSDTTTLHTSTPQTFKQTYNKDGNVSEVYYNDTLTAQNIYDTYGNLISVREFTENPDGTITTSTTNNHIDNFGNTIKTTFSVHGKNVVLQNNYQTDHKTLDSTTMLLGEDKLTYKYVYNTSEAEPTMCGVQVYASDNTGGEPVLYQNITSDHLNRPVAITSKNNTKTFSYVKNGDHATNLISKVCYNNSADNLTYKYDKNGNITEIRQNNLLLNRYFYDSLNRIVREDNKQLDKTYTYAYDMGGNITAKTEYVFTLASNLDKEDYFPHTYTYPLTGWRDQLLSYDNLPFVYDEVGNPTIYKGNILSWSHGRRLDSYNDITYTYNANGIRTSKTVNSVTTNYVYNGTKLLQLTQGEHTMTFRYGVDGVAGFNLDGTEYLYKKDILNNVLEVLSTNNDILLQYTYDAWGNVSTYIPNLDDNLKLDTNIIDKIQLIESLNPFTYRSYVYDSETKLYYLNSRYYDPEICRFVNVDDINTIEISNISNSGLNLYLYCNNNPVKYTDESGYIVSWLIGLLIVSFAFAAANTVIQAASDVVEYIFTGNWNSSWEHYVGAFIGGFFGGATFVLAGGNLGLSLGIMSGVESLSTSLLTNATGKTEYSFTEIIVKAAGSGLLSGIMGSIFGGSKIPGITSGRNSFWAIFKSGITKLINNNASKMSFKVILKGITAVMTLKSIGALLSGTYNAIVDWIKYLFFDEKDSISYIL